MNVVGRILLTILALAGPAAAQEIELAFVNGTYTDLGSGLEPIEEGPLTIELSSPEHRLTIHGNRLTLRPAANGAVTATFAVELEARGQLVADVRGGGIKRRFTDDVAAPPQTVTASADVLIERVDDGFVFTIVRSGPAVAFEVRSGVAGQIVGVCRAIALLPLLDLGCDRLERGLSFLRVPMPEAGKRFLLSDASLTKKERKFFRKLASDPR